MATGIIDIMSADSLAAISTEDAVKMAFDRRVGGTLPFLHYRLPVYLVCTLLSLTVNFALGKDMAWDTLNYHLYAGFSGVNDRLSQDYFAAGPQSYFNPFAFVPFYLLVTSHLSALVISSLFSAVHSIILWLAFEMGVLVSPSHDYSIQFQSGLCAAVFAFINPILLQQIGSCFSDITTAELVVSGWLILASAVRKPTFIKILCAGTILGVATGFKLTNAVHAVSAVATLLLLPSVVIKRAQFLACFGFSVVAGFCIVAAPWSIRLWQMFGNPFFPLANNIFRSPEFTTVPLRHFRFIPDSLADALWRPFALIDPSFMVQEELRAPDMRYATIILLVAGLCLKWLWQQRSGKQLKSTLSDANGSTRILLALGTGFGLDWILWLSGSGNGRYFLPMACIAAIIITGLLFKLCVERRRLRYYILFAVIGTQCIQLAMGTEYRWNGVPWGGAWFDVQIPERLRTDPNLFLSIGAQSNSFIAPYLARGSGLVNLSGGYAFGSESPNIERIKSLVRRYSPKLRILVNGSQLHQDSEHREPGISHINVLVGRLGVRVDPTDCLTIKIIGLPPQLEIAATSSIPVYGAQQSSLKVQTVLLSCHLVATEIPLLPPMETQASAILALDHLEDSCPELFQPRRPYTEFEGRAWVRHYINTDIAAWVSGGQVKFAQAIRGAKLSYLGSEADWAKPIPAPVHCGRRHGLYFVSPLFDPYETH